MVLACITTLTLLVIFACTWGGGQPYIGLHPSGGFTHNGEYASANTAAAHSPRFGSWSGSDVNEGQLTSDVFAAGPAVALLVDGYPTGAGNAIYLERVADGARYYLTFTTDPAERWKAAAFRVPLRWIGKSVRLRAIDASRLPRGWLGVADVRTTMLVATLLRPAGDVWPPTALALLLGTAVLALVPLRARRTTFARLLGRPELFVAVASVTVVFFRLPAITTGLLLNPDEAQMTAQAITFVRHPVPWADFDGTTSGPLNTLAPALTQLAGVTPNLAGSRFIGALVLAAAIGFFYAALRRLSGELSARIAVVLPLAVLCGTTDASCLQYASEPVSILLSAVAIFCLTAIRKPYLGGGVLPAVAGLVIGALVFAKLQAAPLAATLFVGCAVALWRAVPAARRKIAFSSFAAGLVCVPAVIVTAVTANGAFSDFITAYIIFPRYYVAGNCCTFAGLDFFFADPAFAAFFAVSAAAAVVLGAGLTVATAVTRRSYFAPIAPPLIFFVTLAVVAIYTIEAPQTPFIHYLLFLVLPVAGIVAMLAAPCTLARPATPQARWLRRLGVIAFVAVSLAPVFYGSLNDNPFLDHDIFRVEAPRGTLAVRLQQHIKPGQRVAMWGWSPQYLVYTAAVMGTRDSISQFQIDPRPFISYYRNRYLRDFEHNKPDFLLEAVGPSAFDYQDRATQGVAAFPALATILRDRYTTVFDHNDLRLFERNDLLATLPRAGASRL